MPPPPSPPLLPAPAEIFPPLVFPPDLDLRTALNCFQTGGGHLAVVTEDFEVLETALTSLRPPGPIRVSGIVTMEDVIEA